MVKIIPLLLTVLLFFSGGMTAGAEAKSFESADTLETETKTETPADTIDRNAHYRAVQTFLNENRDIFYESIFATFDSEFRQTPELKPLLPLMYDFVENNLEWDIVEPQLVFMYMEVYDKDEIEELAAFMRTEVGQKVARHTPELIRKFQQIGIQLLMENQEQLELMINQYFDEN